jgi:hypothetical protein
VVYGVYLSAQAAIRLEPPFAARQEIAYNPILGVAFYVNIQKNLSKKVEILFILLLYECH